MSTDYSFTGQVLSSTCRHYASGSLSATVKTEGTYDHRDRPVDTWKTLGTGTRTLISRNTYNELGQLRTKGLHSTDGSTFAETASYAYNPRGWLLQINSPKFRQTLTYEAGSSSASVPYFNGNIAGQAWQHLGQAEQVYEYTYDKLDRLIGGYSGTGRSENVSYNAMGNITSLARDGAAAMAYEYPASGSNRLDRITGVGTTYTYDSNGNTTRDGRQNRTITYNALNLPATVGGGNAATYTYDATGRKLRSVVGGVATDYIDGIEWQGTTLNVIHMEEGRILPSGVYQYVLQDHLGSTRSGFASNATGSVNMRSDYYPFGLRHPTGNIAPTPANRYLYNGKELQDGSGYYDYGARFYDPFIGRWVSVDPLAENHHGYSAYAYVLNNPLRFIDPLGLDTLSANNLTPEQWSNANLDEDVLKIDEVLVGNRFSAPIDASRLRTRNYGGDGSGSFHDWLMYGVDQVNQYLPTTHILNSVTYAFSGKDFMGNDLSLGRATFGAATVIPIGKVAGVAVRGVGNAARGVQNSLKAGDLARIQNAATRINKPITVVGSRASGKAGAYSDWDYIIEGGLKNSREWSKIKNSLPGARSITDNTPRNIDILPGPVWPGYPHITIYPR